MTTTGRSFVPEKQSRYNNNTPGDGSSDEYTAHQQPTDETRMNAVMKGDSQIDAGGTAAATAANDDNNSDNPIDDERDPGEVPGTSLRILKYPHPLLRAENTEIDVASDMEPTRQAAREMLKVMYASQGVGLAAPQVGLNEQLLVFNPEGDSRAFLQEVVMVNPKIVATSKKTEVEKEACLSFPGMSGDVKRYEWVKVEGWRLNGKKFKVKLEGWKARIFQHEYDHLNGVVYIDHLDEENRNNIRERLDQLIEDYKQNPYEGIDPAL